MTLFVSLGKLPMLLRPGVQCPTEIRRPDGKWCEPSCRIGEGVDAHRAALRVLQRWMDMDCGRLAIAYPRRLNAASAIDGVVACQRWPASVAAVLRLFDGPWLQKPTRSKAIRSRLGIFVPCLGTSFGASSAPRMPRT